MKHYEEIESIILWNDGKLIITIKESIVDASVKELGNNPEYE